MTGGVNCGGGRRTRLTTVDVCSSGAPLIYIGWRGREAAKGAPQVGGILLGRLPIRPPPSIFFRRRKEGGGRREGRGRPNPSPSFSLPLFPSSSGSAHMGGAAAPAGCCVSPLGPYLCRGCPEPLPVTRYVPYTLQNTFGVRILSSYISIITFRDSSSCL